MARTIENLSIILHWITTGLVIVLFLVFINKTKREKGLILIAAYCLSDSLINLLTHYGSLQVKLYLTAVSTFLEYSLFAAFLYLNIKKASFKKAILYLSCLFIVFSTIYDLRINFSSFDSIPIGIETLLILMFSFYYLYEQTNDTGNLFIYNRYQFWVVIGMLIYLAGSFFVYIFANQLSRNLLTQYWFLTNVFYTLMMVLFAIAIVVFIKQSRNADPYARNLHPYLN